MNLTNIEVGRTYKYKELCEALEDKQTTGTNPRKAQLKEWGVYFRWSNPTSHKFLIEEIYKVPIEKEDGRRNNGGARKNSGSKSKFTEEFNYILNYYISHEYNRNQHELNKPYWHVAYFTSGQIAKEFGLCRVTMYEPHDDEIVDKEVFSKIASRVHSKQRYWIIDKLKRMEGRCKKKKKRETDKTVLLVDGLMAYRYEKDDHPDYRDDLLKDYNKYKKEYMDKNHFRTDHDIISAGKWQEMSEEVSSHFKHLGYVRVKKCHKLFFNPKEKELYDYSLVLEYKKHYNDEIIQDMYDYFLNKILSRLKRFPEENEDYQIELMQAAQEGCSVNYRFTKEKEELLMKPYVYVFDNYVRI